MPEPLVLRRQTKKMADIKVIDLDPTITLTKKVTQEAKPQREQEVAEKSVVPQKEKEMLPHQEKGVTRSS